MNIKEDPIYQALRFISNLNHGEATIKALNCITTSGWVENATGFDMYSWFESAESLVFGDLSNVLADPRCRFHHLR